MMNKELVLRVAEAVEAESLAEFDMDVWSCGTSACIAGFAVMLHDGLTCQDLQQRSQERDPTNDYWLTYVPSRAQDVLSLTNEQAASLFCGFSDATSGQAAETLRRLAETNEVRW